MTLTDFLLARIADDEATAHDRIEDGMDTGWPHAARVLAECEAKRWIVTDLELTIPECGDRQPDGKEGLERVLRNMAMVYAEHPDYDEEWRP